MQKYEVWLQLVCGETTIGEAADRLGVDRSTIMRLRTVAKDGALQALAESKPGVGRGLETGEGYEQAARRELFEETGIVAEELGPVVLERTVRFPWDGVEFDQSEHYFVVRTSVQEISSDRWTEEERQVIVEHRWWTVDELRNASEPVFLEELTRLVESVSR